MSKLSKLFDKVKDKVSEEIDDVKKKVRHSLPSSLVRMGEAVSGDVRQLRGHVIDQGKRVLTSLGDLHVEMHEHLPGQRAVERFLVRSIIRGGGEDASKAEKLWGKVSGAALGLAETSKAAISRNRADELGMTGAQRKAARYQTVALAATVALTAGVGAAVVAPISAAVLSGVGVAASTSLGVLGTAGTVAATAGEFVFTTGVQLGLQEYGKHVAKGLAAEQRKEYASYLKEIGAAGSPLPQNSQSLAVLAAPMRMENTINPAPLGAAAVSPAGTLPAEAPVPAGGGSPAAPARGAAGFLAAAALLLAAL